MADPTSAALPLAVGSTAGRANGWWGMTALIVTEASLFGYLLFAYFYLQSQTEMAWPPEGLPKLAVPFANTIILLGSSVLVWLGERSIRRDRRVAGVAWLCAAVAAGALFVLIQLHEWHGKPYGLTSHVYGSLYFTITGFHLLHVLVGLAVLACLALWCALGYQDSRWHAALGIGALYWHFVDAVWLAVFSVLYLSPYVLGIRP
ncbi:MAG: cytochrome c oxidase subunit 3 [Pseudomonadota bacterium]|nr:cytochrome c oxidase subunit 3 [Pseudomonadota bacterium]